MSKDRKGIDGRHAEDIDPKNDKSLDWGAGEPDLTTPKSNFTEAECNVLQRYIWTIRDLLGLHHWDIYLAEQYAEENTQAAVHPLYGRHVAAIYINKNWFTYHPEDQRNCMVHEMLHVVHNDQTDVVRVGYSSGIKNKYVRNSMWSMFERETEYMVDHLANVLAQHFPLMEELDVEKPAYESTDL